LEVNFRRSVIIAELWRPAVARPEKYVTIFCVFLEKTTPYDKIFKILFCSRHQSTLCSDVKFVRREIGESVRYLPDKQNKISADSQTVATARIAPKICHGQPPTICSSQCSRFHPNRFTFGGVTAERVNTVFLPRRVSP